MHCNFTNKISFFKPNTLIELIKEGDEKNHENNNKNPEKIFTVHFPIHVKVLPRMFEPKELLFDNKQVTTLSNFSVLRFVFMHTVLVFLEY